MHEEMSPKVRFGVHYASRIALWSVVRMRHGVSHFFVKLGNNISLFFNRFLIASFLILAAKNNGQKTVCVNVRGVTENVKECVTKCFMKFVTEYATK